MDRIAALRNIETALAEFERGEADLATVERRVTAVLRTYATDFEDDLRAVYRVGERSTAVVVVAGSPAEARDRAADLAEIDADRAPVERLSKG